MQTLCITVGISPFRSWLSVTVQDISTIGECLLNVLKSFCTFNSITTALKFVGVII